MLFTFFLNGEPFFYAHKLLLMCVYFLNYFIHFPVFAAIVKVR